MKGRCPETISHLQSAQGRRHGDGQLGWAGSTHSHSRAVGSSAQQLAGRGGPSTCPSPCPVARRPAGLNLSSHDHSKGEYIAGAREPPLLEQLRRGVAAEGRAGRRGGARLARGAGAGGAGEHMRQPQPCWAPRKGIPLAPGASIAAPPPPAPRHCRSRRAARVCHSAGHPSCPEPAPNHSPRALASLCQSARSAATSGGRSAGGTAQSRTACTRSRGGRSAPRAAARFAASGRRAGCCSRAGTAGVGGTHSGAAGLNHRLHHSPWNQQDSLFRR